jgi:hypothetical protein
MKFGDRAFRSKYPFLNPVVIIAFLIGVLQLFISHLTPDENKFWKTLTHEIGFALLVAVTIWLTFEFFSHAESEAIWEERIEKMSKNVFFGVFRRNFPPEFPKEANALVLASNFIRSGLHITYNIADESFIDRTGRTQSFVKLNAVLRCKVRNVGDNELSSRLQLDCLTR